MFLKLKFLINIFGILHDLLIKQSEDKKMKKATSQAVAKLAGVSQSTVSLILNGSEKIFFSDATKERVLAAAQELGYKLPGRKKKSSSKQTRLFLVLTPTLANPYYSELIQELESYADQCGYRVIVCNTFRKSELEKYYLEHFNKVSGIIYTFLPSFPHMIEQLAQSLPVVIIGEKQDNLAVCSIELSNIKAGALVAEHLYQLGHRQYMFISTPFNRFTLAREQRLDGMRNFWSAHDLSDCVQVVVPEEQSEIETTAYPRPYEFETGRQLTLDLLDKGCAATAFIGVNDMTALGIIAALKERGLRIPEDYSVCGFDNIFVGSITSPSLTTIDHHLKVRCKAALDMTIDSASKSDDPGVIPLVHKIEYAPQLIARASTGQAPHTKK